MSQSILAAIPGRYLQLECMVRQVEICLAVVFKEY